MEFLIKKLIKKIIKRKNITINEPEIEELIQKAIKEAINNMTIKQFIEGINIKKAEKQLKKLLTELEGNTPSYMEEYQRLGRILEIVGNKKEDTRERQEAYFYGYLLTSNFTYLSRKDEIKKIIKKINI